MAKLFQWMITVGLIAAITGCASNTATTNALEHNPYYIGLAKKPPTTDLVGKNAPEFSLKDMSGHTVSLQSLLSSHKYVFINVWASWCPHCQDEAPYLNAVAKEFPMVQFVSINAITHDKLSDVKRYVVKFNITMPVLLDSHGEFERAYMISSVPTNYLIDPNGKIIAYRNSSLTQSELEQFIKKAIANMA